MEEIKESWLQLFQQEQSKGENDWWLRQKRVCQERNAKIIQVKGKMQPYRQLIYENQQIVEYLLSLAFLIKQEDFFYIEERRVPHVYQRKNGQLISHKKIPCPKTSHTKKLTMDRKRASRKQQYSFSYDHQAAVKYAERWWNDFHPDYKQFTNNCTNFVSQCLYAGGAPMRGIPNREYGWWYENEEWSFSWAVAHSLRWYLSGSTEGLQGYEVERPEDLEPGDVICYDFQGDGRWDHQTIVVAKDVNDMPLVNAHTDHSRHRYWSYEDSTAWTENMAYKFYKIGKS